MSDCLIKFAKFYAATKHKDQTYGNGLPYTHHLQEVANVILRFAKYYPDPPMRADDPDVDDYVAAAWLHDVVEDCGVKIKEIYELFGEKVATLVKAVTNEPGRNRAERHAGTYPKIRETPGATRLKLADRIANVEAGGHLIGMYKKEYEGFKRNLYTPGENEEMWQLLDKMLK